MAVQVNERNRLFATLKRITGSNWYPVVENSSRIWLASGVWGMRWKNLKARVYNGLQKVILRNPSPSHTIASSPRAKNNIEIWAKDNNLEVRGLEHLNVGFGTLEDGSGIWIVQGTILFRVRAIKDKLYVTVQDS